MITENYSFKSTDGMDIQVTKWLPKKEIKAVLHLVHGSVEYAGRYERFAEFLTKKGIAVYAGDIRGHGKTAGTEENLSYFSDKKNGWELAVQDLLKITGEIKTNYPDTPLFIMGHSMGSMLVRDYISRYGKELNGVIFSGTGGGKVMLQYIAIVLSKLFMLLKGRKSRSPFLHNLLYGTLNDDIENAKTDFDFLSRDENEVQKYIDDIFCGYTITPEYLHEMVKGIIKISKSKVYRDTFSMLPVYLFSGEDDPVGGKDSTEVKKIYDNYRSGGLEDVTLKLYPEGRHEMLNEINREEVYKDIFNWINDHC